MSDARENAIELRGIAKSYGAVRAVDGVDLDVAPGELLTLLGPSGCGKSTLLRLVAGFEEPDAGTIRLFGEPIAGDGRRTPPEQRGVGLVFQQLALFPHLDVAGNIGYGLRHLPKAARRARVDELLALVDLADAGARHPDQLSGGQAQRVALARALAPSPRVVLLDEPFSSLDTTLRTSLRSEVRAILRTTGVTAILVTHDQDEALSLGDRVGVMFGGQIVRHGAPRDVYGEPGSADVAVFVGEANRLPDGTLVRPESIELTNDPEGSGVVVNVEYYGHDQAVDVRLPSGVQVRARLGTGVVFEVGGRVRVTTGRDLLE